MAEPAQQFNIHDAKTHLSRIVERVEHGEEIVIARSGQPVAKIVPLPRRTRRSARGSLRGLVDVESDWDSEDVNESIAATFDPR